MYSFIPPNYQIKKYKTSVPTVPTVPKWNNPSGLEQIYGDDVTPDSTYGFYGIEKDKQIAL